MLIIPIGITIHGHMFEIYTMFSDIYDNVDLLPGVKTFIELEADISIRELQFKFLNRSVPAFAVHKEIIKVKEMRYMKV